MCIALNRFKLKYTFSFDEKSQHCSFDLILGALHLLCARAYALLQAHFESSLIFRFNRIRACAIIHIIISLSGLQVSATALALILISIYIHVQAPVLKCKTIEKLILDAENNLHQK